MWVLPSILIWLYRLILILKTLLLFILAESGRILNWLNYVSPSGVKIRQALGPMARKIPCGPSKLTLGDSDTVIDSINKMRKYVPLKDCEGPQIYNIKGRNGPSQFLLILTPCHHATHLDYDSNCNGFFLVTTFYVYYSLATFTKLGP